MKEIAKDLIQMPIDNNDTLFVLWDKFYSIMRKHGLRKGTKNESGGISYNNYEWSACEILFLESIRSHFVITSIMSNVIPNDLDY